MPAARPDMQPLVWITGASQGLGRALALHYAAAGWQVVASARQHDALQQLQRDATGLAGAITPLPLDITDRAAVQAVVAYVATLGTVQLAILNAGTHIQQPLAQQPFAASAVQQLLDLNVMGTVHCIEALLPHLQQAATRLPRPPQLAVVASLAGYRGLPAASGYGASKAALINLSESLRPDLHAQGIDMRLINPGFVKTPLTDKNPFPMPEIISAERAAQYIYRGLAGSRFEIRFPPRFALAMATLRLLPYRLYFAIIRHITGQP